MDLFFHLEGLISPKEVGHTLETLFVKHDEMRRDISENDLIALQPSNFETIQLFLLKFKSLVLQCKQCGIEKKDEQLVLSIMSKLG